jgi:ADP-heptose:LPS heptosyltransferase
MSNQLVPHDLLQKADKILFVTHLALGDFTYMQTYFAAFARQYPHIKIHLWVDEVRRTRCFWKWDNLKRYVLYDWVRACSFFHKIYDQTYSVSLFKKSIQDAQAENYPIVVSLCTLRSEKYAKLARNLSPNGFVVGVRQPTRMLQFFTKLAYKKLDAALDVKKFANQGHISNCYAAWFLELFGLEVAEGSARAPFVAIPRQWISFAKLRFLMWGFDKRSQRFGKVFFINAFAKNDKRCWPLENLFEVLTLIKQHDNWADINFIVNVDPAEQKRVQKFFASHSINSIVFFSAQYHFFQLPAIISLCDLVISVETSVIHLASALKVPVVALMRQKNPEWVPWDLNNGELVMCAKRSDWIKDIPAKQVVKTIEEVVGRLS